MSQLYDLEFNKDDVILRNIIVGVLATLNNKMWWYQQISQTEKQKVHVPFYFSTTGDERFLMDMFMNTVSAGGTDTQHAESVYNQLPRAILQLESLAIDAGSLTNKYVRAFYQRVQEDGTLATFNSEVFMVPLKLAFNVDLYVDSNLDVFKGMQRTIEIFYKHNLFQIDVDGTRIPAVASLPEDFAKERPIEFTFGDKKEWKINYTIEVQTFMPIFKNEDNGFIGPKNTEMFAGNVMEGFDNITQIAQQGGFTPIEDPFNPNPGWAGAVNAPGSPPKNAWPYKPSGYSNPIPPKGGATGPPGPTAPSAPEILTIVGGTDPGTILLTIAPGDPGSGPITDYEYSLNGSNTWTPFGSTSTSLKIGPLSSGTTYEVEIRAESDIGHGDVSNTATVTTT